MNRTSLSLILALAVGLTLRAEGPTGPWYAGVLLNTAPSSLSGDIGGAKGFSVHGGYTFWTGHAGTGYRVTAEVGTLSGWDLQITQKGAKLTHLQVGGELLVNTPSEKLKFLVGVNANQWKVSADQVDGTTYNANMQGTKLGGKIGLEYFVSRNLSARVTWSVVEAGTSSDFLTPPPEDKKPTNGWKNYDEGKYAMTPSWLQLGVSWHF